MPSDLSLKDDDTRPLVYSLPDELRNAPVEKRGERRAALQVIAGSSSRE
ncbi:Virulence-associated protein E domain protein [Stigmatella aurantiaca DW4/3-1]|nr:Virulence-associated protein E domain protein [Stigmatella aurantiaca DW4/3-1]